MIDCFHIFFADARVIHFLSDRGNLPDTELTLEFHTHGGLCRCPRARDRFFYRHATLCDMWFSIHHRADPKLAPSQWEPSLQSNAGRKPGRIISFIYQKAQADGSIEIRHASWRPFLGLRSRYPLLLVKLQQLIWRSGTRRWNLRVSDLQMSCDNLTKW